MGSPTLLSADEIQYARDTQHCEPVAGIGDEVHKGITRKQWHFHDLASVAPAMRFIDGWQKIGNPRLSPARQLPSSHDERESESHTSAAGRAVALSSIGSKMVL